MQALENWEYSNKRCQTWKYTASCCPRPFAAGVFGLNLAKDEFGIQCFVDIDFVKYQFERMFPDRITDDLSTIDYGDDEWIIYLLIMFYFKDSKGRVDISRVYLLSRVEHCYFTIFKRYNAIGPEQWQHRYMKVVNFIESTNVPHFTLKNSPNLLNELYK